MLKDEIKKKLNLKLENEKKKVLFQRTIPYDEGN